ncbi:MAG TPA: tetratricopeptide repeat protein [Ignavibacteriaceae bacterium]|nr:tetratricopeptide repeat protein [Ignavibacteriaceae bacterium]
MKSSYLILLTLLTAFCLNTNAQNTEYGLVDSLETKILIKLNALQWGYFYSNDGTMAHFRNLENNVKIENNCLVFNFKELGVRSVNLINNSFEIIFDTNGDDAHENHIWVGKVLKISNPYYYTKNGDKDDEEIVSANEQNYELFDLFKKYQKEYIEENDKQLIEKRLKELEEFRILSQNFRELTEKPSITEEQRKFLVQANVRNDEKKYTEALALYEKALKINPFTYPSAYYNMALISAQLKKYKYAIFNMRKYLMLVPEAEDARKGQDKIYEWELNLK